MSDETRDAKHPPDAIIGRFALPWKAPNHAELIKRYNPNVRGFAPELDFTVFYIDGSVDNTQYERSKKQL